MSRKTRYHAPPTFKFCTMSRNLFEGWKFSRGEAYGSSRYPCIVCQLSKPLLLKLLLKLIMKSKQLVDIAEWEDLLNGERDGGLGFFSCRLTRYGKDDRIVRSMSYNDIEPSKVYSVLGKYFDDLYRDGYVSLEIAPLTESNAMPFMIHLTRGMLIRVFAYDPAMLMDYLDELGEVGLRRDNRLKLTDSFALKYRRSEHTNLMWPDLLEELNPKSRRFEREGFGDGDLPQGV